MGLNTSKVMVGTPDQLVTGAVLDAPVGTVLPTKTDDQFNEAFKDSGYISDAGLSLTINRSTNAIKDWSKKTLRKILSEFDGTLKWSELQMDERSLKRAFGENNVKVTPATSAKGAEIAISIDGTLPDPRAWVFKIKDGKARILIVVPNGQVTEMDDITFAAEDPIALPLTLSASPDSKGNSIYIYLNDGVVTG